MQKVFYHVLHCKPQKDLRAKINAQECGWMATVFWFKEPPKQAGRSPRWRALMPGYVFVTGGANYYALQNPLYVNRLLDDGAGNPYKIYEDHPDMAKLLARADDKGYVESATAPMFEYGKGDIIEFLFGGTDATARIAAMNKRFVEVELGNFGAVKVPHEQVKRKVSA